MLEQEHLAYPAAIACGLSGRYTVLGWTYLEGDPALRDGGRGPSLQAGGLRANLNLGLKARKPLSGQGEG